MLELLFDLTFAVAVAVATGASQLAHSLAHSLAHGHVAAGVGSSCFTSFGIIWAWIDYSWFASAYDTDDWLHRLLTMVQMIGVVIFTLATLVTPIELAEPAVAERGTGTPWHAHHIVERRGQLTIITMGEIVTGTS